MQPVKHVFEYPVYFFALSVDALKSLSGKIPFFSLNRWNVLSLDERRYLKPGNETLRKKVEMLLSERGITEKPSSIELVTQLRYFGWVFNPVSFFFCRGVSGDLLAVIADVNNTFGEGHAYVLRDFKSISADRIEARAAKVFHVSPFFEKKGEYRFEFEFNPGHVQIILDYWEGGKLLLASSWKGTRLPFETGNLLSVLARFPFGGWLTVARIHFQAILLYFVRKLPVFKKPEAHDLMTIRKKT